MKGILAILSIREGEGGRLGFAILLNLLVAFGMYLGRGARDALFYTQIGAEWLPVMFAANAVFSLLINELYGRILGKVPQDRLFRGTLWVFSVGVAVIALMVAARPMLSPGRLSDWLVYGTAFAATETMAIILVVATANYVNDPALFDLGGIKRLSPYYVSASHAGGLLAGIAIMNLQGRMRVEHLLWFWAAFLVLASFLAQRISCLYYRTYRATLPTLKAEGGFASTSRYIGRSRYLVYFVIVTALNFFLGSSYEWILARNATKQAGATPEVVAAYVGNVFLYGGIVAIVFQLVFMRFIIRRFGVALANFGAPIALAFGAACVFFRVESVYSAIIARTSFYLAENGFNQTLIRFVYNVVPERDRMRVQAFIESNVITLSVAASGGILLLFSIANVNILYFAFLVVLVAGATLWFTYRIKVCYGNEARRNYGVMSSLGRGLLLEDVFGADDAESRDIVKFVHDQGEAGSLVQAIRTVGRLRAERHYPQFVYGRLTDMRRPVRLAAVEAVRQVGNSSDKDRLRPLLQDPDPEVMVAALRAFGEISGEAVEADDLEGFLNNPEPRVVSVAVAQLMHNAGVKGMRVAVERLEALRGSANTQDQIVLVRTFGELGQRTVPDLLDLWRDGNTETRLAIVEAMGGIPSRAVLPRLFEALGDPHLLRAARASLLKLVRSLHGDLIDAFRDSKHPAAVRGGLAWVLGETDLPDLGFGRGGLDAVTSELRQALRSEDLFLREEAGKALAKRVGARRAPPFPLSEIEELVSLRFKEAVCHRVARDTLQNVWAQLPLSQASFGLLDKHIGDITDRTVLHIVDLLAMVFPNDNLLGLYKKLGTDRGREEAIEALENTLSRRMARDLRVLFDPVAYTEYVSMTAGLPVQEGAALEHLLRLNDKWLPACLWRAYRSLGGGQERLGLLGPIGQALGQRKDDIQMLTDLDRASILAQAPLFRPVPLGDLIQAAHEVEDQELSPGSYVYQSDQPLTHLYVLYQGKVTILSGDGDHQERVGEVQATDTLGEMGVFAEGGIGESARADSTCRCLAVRREIVLELIELRPELSYEVVRILWKRLVGTYAQLRDHVNIGKQVSATIADLLEKRLVQLDKIDLIEQKVEQVLNRSVQLTVVNQTGEPWNVTARGSVEGGSK